jgi:hypothetical protein
MGANEIRRVGRGIASPTESRKKAQSQIALHRS